MAATKSKPRSAKPRVRLDTSAVAESSSVAQQPAQKSFRLASNSSFLRGLSSNSVGNWASDHRKESEHVTGWSYIAITAICMQAMQAECNVFDDKGSHGPRVKSARMSVRKSMRNDPIRRATTWCRYWKSLYSHEHEATEPLGDEVRIARLMRRPNPSQSGAMFRYEQVMQLQATGTCIVWNRPNSAGVTIERYVIPTAVATPVQPNQDLPRGGYRIDPSMCRFRSAMDAQGFVEMAGWVNALGQTIPAEQCQIIRWPHPFLKDDGLAPMAACAVFKDTADQVHVARWGQMKNGFHPSFVILIDPACQPSQEELEAAAAKIQDKYGGVENHGRVFVMAGGHDVKPLGFSAKDMDYQNGFTQTRDAELAIFRTPPVAAGIQEAGAYAAYYASLKQFIELTCQPIFDVLAEEDTGWFTRKRPDGSKVGEVGAYVQEYDDSVCVEIEASPVDDPEVLERQLQTDIAGGYRMVDEFRSVRGLPLLGGKEGKRMVGNVPVPVAAAPSSEGLAGSGAPRPGLVQKPGLLGGQGGGMAQPVAASGGAADGATPDNITATESLNGAQITAAVTVLEGVTAGRMAHLVAVELLIALGIDRERCERMVLAAEQQEYVPPPQPAGFGGPIEEGDEDEEADDSDRPAKGKNPFEVARKSAIARFYEQQRERPTKSVARKSVIQRLTEWSPSGRRLVPSRNGKH